MDETGFVYESTSGKSNLHPSYNPVSSGIVDESGTPYSALGIPVPSYLTVPASAAAAAKGSYYGYGSGSGGSGSGGSGSGTDNSPFKLVNGEMQFSDPNLQAAWTMIQQTAKANNDWSAEQAQKQMDFQLMMSSTAHQREIKDLQAAGLNPVLSAGGSGAQVTSGAMGQVDNSNTRLVAELAGAALDAVTTTALGVSGAFGSGSKSGSALQNNYFLRRAGGTAASVAAAILTRKALGAMLAAL